MMWSVPRIWDGQTCAIFASGSSMSLEIAETVRRVKPIRSISINTTFRLAPWADMLYASDARWWIHYKDEVAQFEGLKVSVEAAPIPGLLQLTNSGKDGFDDDPANVRGANSGYAAVHVAAHAGCKRIILCGFDMHGQRWHGRHPEPLRNPGDGIYARWIAGFETIAPKLTKLGIEVINCTPGSALKCFPSADLEDALAPRRVAA